MKLSSVLDRFFRTQVSSRDGDGIVIAFSGGPDSTALLIGLRDLAERRRIQLYPAHLDHGLDPGSTERASGAARICADLGLELNTERLPTVDSHLHSRGSSVAGPGNSHPTGLTGGESLEATARRLRYRFLEDCRQRHGASWIATAHHRDDQIETALLRIQFGSGVAGLAGIQPVRGRIIRPLLEVSHQDLRAVCADHGTVPVEDPTNFDLSIPRNRLRHSLLPHLMRADPDVPAATLAAAAAAGRARVRIDRLLHRHLDPRLGDASVRVDRSLLASLPLPIWPFALALMHRLAGAEYPPGEAARRELRRQLAAERRIGCDCGDGWCWTAVGSDLQLARRQEVTADFTYTLEVPGEVDIPELGLGVRLSQGPIADWMMRGSSTRAGMALPIAVGDRLTIRNRRPGDRIQPFGCRYQRRLKELLIDRRIPRWERDRLPLLCLDDRIAWVPGVTVDESFRLAAAGTAWIAELT